MHHFATLKVSLSLWFGIPSSQKILQLGSFQMYQNKHRGTMHQNFLGLPSREKVFPCAWKHPFQHEIDKIRFHNILILSQWIRMWHCSFIVFAEATSISIVHPLLMRISMVRIFTQVASQAKRKKKTGSHRGMGPPNFFSWEHLFTPIT